MTLFCFRLFSGVLPRMMWISVGGAIFLGVFDKARKTINNSVYYTQNVAVTWWINVKELYYIVCVDYAGLKNCECNWTRDQCTVYCFFRMRSTVQGSHKHTLNKSNQTCTCLMQGCIFEWICQDDFQKPFYWNQKQNQH